MGQDEADKNQATKADSSGTIPMQAFHATKTPDIFTG